MNKTSPITPSNLLSSSHLRGKSNSHSSTVANHQPFTQGNLTPSQIQAQKHRYSLAIFKYFIFTTSIVFAFGGLGFGLVWRYGSDLQISLSNITHHQLDK